MSSENHYYFFLFSFVTKLMQFTNKIYTTFYIWYNISRDKNKKAPDLYG